MRLTLRTMLAYLDDILDQGDAQDLGRKIEESEFASSLVGRIRDVSRRLRLGAPKLTGRGMGLDPNTVAEYLDNTLAVARVPDFEKICLESDMHLAEVACSHQILALVLGGPAEVNLATRQRMYRLQSRAEEATIAIAPAPVKAEQSMPIYTPRPKQPVPEYLRDNSSGVGSWLKIAAAVLVLAGLGVAVFMAVGPFNFSDSGGDKVAVAPADQPAAAVAPGALSAPAGESAQSVAEPSAAPAETADLPPRRPSEIREPDGDSAPDQAPTVPAAPVPEEPPAVDDMPDENAETAAEAPPVNGDAEPTGEAADEAAPVEAAPTGGAEVVAGRLISPSTVMLYWQGDEAGWTRVPDQSEIAVDDELLSLPTYRPMLSLTGGVTMQLVGDTQLRVMPATGPEVPSVDIRYGRMVLMSTGKVGAQLSISVGELRGTLTLAEAASVVGVEVRPTRAEGSNPETDQPVLHLDLYVASGQVDWMDASQAAPESFVGPQHWSWPVAVTEEASTFIPNWVLDVEDTPAIDRKAAESIAQIFALDKPARLELKQLAEHRRSEIRSLAVRCLAAIGNYDALIKSLSDDTNRSGWKEQVDSLRNALAQGPEAAARVRTSLERLRGARSAELYRMLWGYSPAQLKAGAATELVQYLDDEKNLDVRVVAFCTLERIAGKGLAYRPTDNPKARQPHLQKWRQWAADYQAAGPAGDGAGFP